MALAVRHARDDAADSAVGGRPLGPRGVSLALLTTTVFWIGLPRTYGTRSSPRATDRRRAQLSLISVSIRSSPSPWSSRSAAARSNASPASPLRRDAVAAVPPVRPPAERSHAQCVRRCVAGDLRVAADRAAPARRRMIDLAISARPEQDARTHRSRRDCRGPSAAVPPPDGRHLDVNDFPRTRPRVLRDAQLSRPGVSAAGVGRHDDRRAGRARAPIEPQQAERDDRAVAHRRRDAFACARETAEQRPCARRSRGAAHAQRALHFTRVSTMGELTARSSPAQPATDGSVVGPPRAGCSTARSTCRRSDDFEDMSPTIGEPPRDHAMRELLRKRSRNRAPGSQRSDPRRHQARRQRRAHPQRPAAMELTRLRSSCAAIACSCSRSFSICSSTRSRHSGSARRRAAVGSASCLPCVEATSRSRCGIRARGSTPAARAARSSRSTRPNAAAWAWDCRSHGRSSRPTAEPCARGTAREARSWSSHCRRLTWVRHRAASRFTERPTWAAPLRSLSARLGRRRRESRRRACRARAASSSTARPCGASPHSAPSRHRP